jgi:hypothetical protein
MKRSGGDGHHDRRLYDEGWPMAAIVLAAGMLVYVREYLRRRFGRWEIVRSHYRSWPRS